MSNYPWGFTIVPDTQKLPTPVLSVTSPENNIVFNTGTEETLRVAEDGFYIRGIKVPADEREAREVYECFKEWLAWSTLNK
jgi:hypothetical protein